HYDKVNNPTSIVDTSNYPWPAGIRPSSRGLIVYDDRYRVTSVPTSYDGGDDPFDKGQAQPYGPEIAAGNGALPAMRLLDNRIKLQSFAYDWLDNVRSSDDDQHTAPDRSFGTATYATTGPFPQPHRFVSSTQGGTTIAASYDAAGNTTAVTVTR